MGRSRPPSGPLISRRNCPSSHGGGLCASWCPSHGPVGAQQQDGPRAAGIGDSEGPQGISTAAVRCPAIPILPLDAAGEASLGAGQPGEGVVAELSHESAGTCAQCASRRCQALRKPHRVLFPTAAHTAAGAGGSRWRWGPSCGGRQLGASAAECDRHLPRWATQLTLLPPNSPAAGIAVPTGAVAVRLLWPAARLLPLLLLLCGPSLPPSGMCLQGAGASSSLTRRLGAPSRARSRGWRCSS